MMATPDRVIYQAPSRSSITTWNPARVRSALAGLQQGHFHQIASLWDAILGDDRAQAVMSSMSRGVLALPILFESADQSQAALDAAAQYKADYWSIYPEDVKDELITYALGVGAAPAQIIYERRDGRWIPTLEPWHPSLLRHEETRDEWRILTRRGEVELIPGDGKWVLYRPGGKRRYWLKAFVRSLAIPWLAKQYAITDWQRFSERLGSGVVKGKVPAGAGDPDKKQFRQDLLNLANQGVAIVPEGFDIDLVEASAWQPEAFDRLIGWADTAMTIAIMGQNLTTEVSGGSFAAATVHERIEANRLQWAAEAVSTTEREQVTVWWAEFNLVDRKLAPWARHDASPPEDLKTTAEGNEAKGHALNALIDATRNAGLELDVMTVAEQMSIPILRKKEASALRLASGDPITAASGMVNGQLYADRIADEMIPANQPAVQALLKTVQGVIRSASSYEELRASIYKLYQEQDIPADMQESLTNSMVLAFLGGRYAVVEDA